jgi:hypothetical protein
LLRAIKFVGKIEIKVVGQQGNCKVPPSGEAQTACRWRYKGFQVSQLTARAFDLTREMAFLWGQQST